MTEMPPFVYSAYRRGLADSDDTAEPRPEPTLEDLITDDDVLAALTASIAANPTGATWMDVLSRWNLLTVVSASLDRLAVAGKLKATSPGNYLPTDGA